MERGGSITGADDDAARLLRATAPEELAGVRLDRVLASLFPELSRARIQRLVADGRVTVDGEPAAKVSRPVEALQALTIDLPPAPAATELRAEPLDLDIVYEDDDLVVVNKRPGLIVHAGAGVHGTTLVNGLLHLYGDSLSRIGGDDRPGIVHRLDKGTSGVMTIARNDRAHRALSAQFAARSVEKEYAAVVYGCPRDAEGSVDLPIGRDRADRTKISGDTDRPRDARSRWELAEDLGGFALLRVFPETGRMHQVRAHLVAIHHACIGDHKYAGAQWKGVEKRWLRDLLRTFERPALHAHRLRLEHPGGGGRMEFSAPLPDDLEHLLESLRRHRDEP